MHARCFLAVFVHAAFIACVFARKALPIELCRTLGQTLEILRNLSANYQARSFLPSFELLKKLNQNCELSVFG